MFEVFKTQWKKCWNGIQVVSASEEKGKRGETRVLMIVV